jgi:hypothetical protein
MSVIDLGRLLRSATTAFVVGCRVNQLDHPSFGGLVRVPLDNGTCIYGLIYDIHIDDDGLVRQLVTAEDVDENIIADNRLNRNIPLEMSVLTVGYSKGDKIYHLLPPVPPLSLDRIYLCDPPGAVHLYPNRPLWVFPAYLEGSGSAGQRAAGSPSPASSPGTA